MLGPRPHPRKPPKNHMLVAAGCWPLVVKVKSMVAKRPSPCITKHVNFKQDATWNHPKFTSPNPLLGCFLTFKPRFGQLLIIVSKFRDHQNDQRNLLYLFIWKNNSRMLFWKYWSYKLSTGTIRKRKIRWIFWSYSRSNRTTGTPWNGHLKLY